MTAWLLSGTAMIALSLFSREHWLTRMAIISFTLGGLADWATKNGHLPSPAGENLAMAFFVAAPILGYLGLRKEKRNVSS